MRGFPQHYAPKSEFHPNQVNDPFRRNMPYQMGNNNFLKQYDDFQKSPSNGYSNFFPNTSLKPNQSKSTWNDNLSFNSVTDLLDEAENFDENSKFSDLNKAFQKSQIQVLNQQFIYPIEKTTSNKNNTNFSSTQAHQEKDLSSSQGFQFSSGKSPNQPKEFNSKGKFPKKQKLNPKVERFLEEIEKLDMNSISLLNEVSGKLKKKVEYKITESSMGRTKNFDCVCLIDNNVIGTKNGNSKQNAKAEAAKEGICTILTDEKYLTESAAIILSIQKANEKNLKQEKSDKSTECTTPPFSGQTSNDFELNLSDSKSDKDQITLSLVKEENPTLNAKESHYPKSALYELNILSRRLLIEPLWSFPFEANEDGDFEVSLQFGDLIVQEKGKKKQEAKKEAALKMIEKIKETQKMEKPIVSQPGNRLKVNEASAKKRNDRSKAIFQKALKPNMLAKIQAKEDSRFQPLTQELSLDAQVNSILKKYELNQSTSERLQNFFQKIMNYTSIITSNPKLIMLDAEKHLADFVKDCYLIPIGSFALGSMRSDKLSIDTLLLFQEVKGLSDLELLELYKTSLEVCYGLDQQSGTNVSNMKFQFTIQSNNQRNYLEITEMEKTGEHFKLHVLIPNKSQENVSQSLKNLPITHIQKMYASLDNSLEELNSFRSLLKIMKIWMENSRLEEINSEIIDVVLLSTFLNRRSSKIHDNVVNCLTILQSEALTQSVLSQFDQNYLNLYQGLSNESKEKLVQNSHQSLMYIFENNFTRAQIF